MCDYISSLGLGLLPMVVQMVLFGAGGSPWARVPISRIDIYCRELFMVLGVVIGVCLCLCL